MGFVAIAAVLVAFSVSLASSQLDCAEPTNSDLENVISRIIPTGENPTIPTVNVLSLQPVCLAVSEQRDRYRLFSVVVQYTCVGNVRCPVGTATEQIESDCVNGVWENAVLGTTVNTRRTDPTANLATSTRMDCAFCLSHAFIVEDGLTLITDNTTHCVGCTGCSENVGQNSCFGNSDLSCCNVYVNDMCDTDCPTTGMFTIDPDTFVCLATCPDLGNNVENGNVVYTKNETGGRYSQGTNATVSCSGGYSGGGGITCQDTGDWSSPDLPSCKIIDCGRPPDLANGKFTLPDSTTFGSTVTYECDTDLIFSEDSTDTRTCLATGSWSDDTIKCQVDSKSCEPACLNGGVCDNKTGECVCPSDLNGPQCETCELPNCKACVVVDGKATCQECSADFEKEKNSNDKCNPITSGSDGGLCILCIVLPIAIILAIILAIAVAIAVYAYYRWKQAPPTKLKEKDPEGLNGVARDNPLYLDPTTVAEEVEE